MRKALAFMCILILTAAGATQTSPSEKRSLAKQLVGPEGLGRTASGAAIGTLRNSPHEWGQGPAGFGKRFASGLGRHIAKTTIHAGVGALHHEDLHYPRSNLHGTGARLK